jgi:dGTPase
MNGIQRPCRSDWMINGRRNQLTKVIGTAPTAPYSRFDIERQHEEDEFKDKKRSPFEIDKARILHSSAFRRLQGKTQVLGAGQRDFYRTRLTHSLEVMQIARGLSAELEFPEGCRVDPDLLEAICLAHDIGHPPFGHNGEHTLHRLLLPEGGFGANPQNLRIVTYLEAKHASGGLNLCRATLDGLMKYKALFDPVKHGSDSYGSKFLYRDQRELLEWIQVSEEISLEGQIAEWADTIAYSVNDIEDNLRAGLLDLVQLEKRSHEIVAQVRTKLPDAGEDEIRHEIEQVLDRLLRAPRTERERKIALRSWTSRAIYELMQGCKIEERERGDSFPSRRYLFKLEIEPSARRKSSILKTISRVLVFNNPRVTTLNHKGAAILSALFSILVKDVNLLPYDYRELVLDRRYCQVRLVGDFIAGMTDTYAQQYYARLTQPGAGSSYEYV